jgi:CheY-like chemotaxis protein
MKKILIVEDDQNIAKALSIRLEAAGYEVTVAPDALTGLAVALKIQPDLAVLDIYMKKSLIVEDDQDIVKALAIRLKSAGYEVTVAPDALTGCSRAPNPAEPGPARHFSTCGQRVYRRGRNPEPWRHRDSHHLPDRGQTSRPASKGPRPSERRDSLKNLMTPASCLRRSSAPSAKTSHQHNQETRNLKGR